MTGQLSSDGLRRISAGRKAIQALNEVISLRPNVTAAS